MIAGDAAQVDSVRAQWYPYWELCTDLENYRGLDPRIKIYAGSPDSVMEMSTGEYLLFLDGPIAPEALFAIVKTNRFDSLVRKNSGLKMEQITNG